LSGHQHVSTPTFEKKNTMDACNVTLADLMLRIFAGTLFLFQGYDKLFRIGMAGVVNAFREEATSYHIPSPALKTMAYYTSIAEFVGGLFLILGFYTTYALYALGIDLLLVTFAFSYLSPMWDLKHVFPRFILVTALILIPEAARIFALDHFLNFNLSIN
jgi:putative oxidoreductase